MDTFRKEECKLSKRNTAHIHTLVTKQFIWLKGLLLYSRVFPFTWLHIVTFSSDKFKTSSSQWQQPETKHHRYILVLPMCLHRHILAEGGLLHTQHYAVTINHSALRRTVVSAYLQVLLKVDRHGNGTLTWRKQIIFNLDTSFNTWWGTLKSLFQSESSSTGNNFALLKQIFHKDKFGPRRHTYRQSKQIQ